MASNGSGNTLGAIVQDFFLDARALVLARAWVHTVTVTAFWLCLCLLAGVKAMLLRTGPC